MAVKNILGLDLGTTSIGWAHVREGETAAESEIVSIGVRVNPLTNDEQTNFEKGRPITINADRTLKRSARRNLQRYKLRRANLLEILIAAKLLKSTSEIVENGPNSTFETWFLRAKAAKERIEKDQFARVLLAINKKRGYKSSRKAKNEEDGELIDGMEIAKKLYDNNLTPGQFVLQLLEKGVKSTPSFYRSDLQAEFDRIWKVQQAFYPDVLTFNLYQELIGKGQRATAAILYNSEHKIFTAENKGTPTEKKTQAYQWRTLALTTKLSIEEVAYVLADINNSIKNSSGYLGAISDRSKELYFNKQTIGQAITEILHTNPHSSLKNKVYYRQDYMDEFEQIWSEQSKHHPELTAELKHEIRDVIIFYQRKLKSQKGLISFCEFEQKIIEINGKEKRIGQRVAPKSSPLFQEFKIWQILGNVTLRNKLNKQDRALLLSQEDKALLFEELNLKGNLSSNKVLDILGLKPKEWEMNYTTLEGNHTNKCLFEAYLKIIELEGNNIKDLMGISTAKEEVELGDISLSAQEIKSAIKSIFESIGIETGLLDFDAELEGKAFEQQPSYQIWHLLYAYEDDQSASGNERLIRLLQEKFGFKKNEFVDHTALFTGIQFLPDYGNLSTKAMRKIITHIKENNYSDACVLANYRHSAASLTREEIESRELKEELTLLKKNSLRNPVVEKILNQMVNVVNTLLQKNRAINPSFQFDEIRIELARELKKNASERADMTQSMSAGKATNERVAKILNTEFNIKNPSRNDIIRYKLYEELKNNGYHDLYTNTDIPKEKLFSKEVDIEHIIPQSRMFDDSFSNKTIVYRQTNLEKGNQTAYTFIENKQGELGIQAYKERIERLFHLGIKNKEEGISKAKYQKLLKVESEIGDGFIERDLRDSQYIAKQAKNMLFDITRKVVSTSGSITDRLREDWGLINVMKELNFEKYKALGLTEVIEKHGKKTERIIDWTKRNDHRHHAMDALTVAFTKHEHIQYLNHLNARKDESHKEHSIILGIERKLTEVSKDDTGNSKRRFISPVVNFRSQAKTHLSQVLVSHKAKNKVVTKNKNITKTKKGEHTQLALTPRGQLHKETVYGKYAIPMSKMEKIGAKTTLEVIEKVGSERIRKALLQRLNMFDNDPKKAFTGKNSLDKNPIVIDETTKTCVPEMVKLTWYESDYSIRKEINPTNFKDLKTIEKVLDQKIKSLLINRFKASGNDPKKAFSDLENNPIWVNKDKGIQVKRATISGVSNALPLHVKKDHLGQDILDAAGQQIPVDFISTGNNHHVAIYRDADGKLQERIVSLFEAVQLINADLPVIDKTFNQNLGWTFLFSMKQNEYFVFANEKTGFDPNQIDLLDPVNKAIISENLYRVQKLTYKNYYFRHHLETTVEDKKELANHAYKSIRNNKPLEVIVKIRLNHLGDVVHVGE